VARIDQEQVAIGSRGFHGRFDNKLLVLIDGAGYNLCFRVCIGMSRDVMLRRGQVEVIRGRSTLWGAMPSTGVINVITKKAKPRSLQS